jgi:hypothetical protein
MEKTRLILDYTTTPGYPRNNLWSCYLVAFSEYTRQLCFTKNQTAEYNRSRFISELGQSTCLFSPLYVNLYQLSLTILVSHPPMLGIKAGARSRPKNIPNGWGNDGKFHIAIQSNESKQPPKHVIDLESQEGISLKFQVLTNRWPSNQEIKDFIPSRFDFSTLPLPARNSRIRSNPSKTICSRTRSRHAWSFPFIIK